VYHHYRLQLATRVQYNHERTSPRSQATKAKASGEAPLLNLTSRYTSSSALRHQPLSTTGHARGSAPLASLLRPYRRGPLPVSRQVVRGPWSVIVVSWSACLAGGRPWQRHHRPADLLPYRKPHGPSQYGEPRRRGDAASSTEVCERLSLPEAPRAEPIWRTTETWGRCVLHGSL